MPELLEANNKAASTQKLFFYSIIQGEYSLYLCILLSGFLLPLSFAPFHMPGMAILSLAYFYNCLTNKNIRPFLGGLIYGLGYFGLGISWIFVSIHTYGHLNYFIASCITFIFLLYLSLFTAIMASMFKHLYQANKPILSILLFSALWVLCEYIRGNLFSGFPWLLLGFGQFDAPSKYLLPLIGILGVSFVTCVAASLLAVSRKLPGYQRYLSLSVFVLLVLLPNILQHKQWSEDQHAPLSVAVMQANLSMRDKWDETLLWQLLSWYKEATEQTLGTKLIVMPESAIPLPANYVADFLLEINNKAKEAGSAILLGIPQSSPLDENFYFNALMGLGLAHGTYLKQHLVPFGEYIPKLFQSLTGLLHIPAANIIAGSNQQSLIRVGHHRIATLICYEIAYSNLLRQQLPNAAWIVSISEDGWFGHSFAMYQHLQMAQVLSLASARPQIVANNDGLSSVINKQGTIIASLPAFSPGILKSQLIPATGTTPWVWWGDTPIILGCLLLVIWSCYSRVGSWALAQQLHP